MTWSAPGPSPPASPCSTRAKSSLKEPSTTCKKAATLSSRTFSRESCQENRRSYVMSKTARLGAFILGTLAVLAVGVFIIGSKKYLFTPTYQLKTKFKTVAGLQTGADILVGGVHSGTVRSIELPSRPDDQVLVTLQM